MRIFSKELGTFINVHPTFLYESILDFSIFVILMMIRKNRKFDGQLLYIYLIVYGTGRSIIEGLRTDSLMLGNMRVSQILSIIIVLYGIIMYFLSKKVDEKVQRKLDWFVSIW